MDGAAVDVGRGAASVLRLREMGTRRARCISAERNHPEMQHPMPFQQSGPNSGPPAPMGQSFLQTGRAADLHFFPHVIS